MLICYDQRNGSGCNVTNPNNAPKCHNCGRNLQFALHLHDPNSMIKHYQIIQGGVWRGLWRQRLQCADIVSACLCSNCELPQYSWVSLRAIAMLVVLGSSRDRACPVSTGWLLSFSEMFQRNKEL
jgi:hypothetical protein